MNEKKKIIAVEDFLSKDLPRYWCIVRLKTVLNGEFEVLLNFGQGDIPRELMEELGKVKVLCYSNGQVIIEVGYHPRLPASAIFNAMLQAQEAGILPK